MIYGMRPEHHKSRSHRHYCCSVTVALKFASRELSLVPHKLSLVPRSRTYHLHNKKTRRQPEKSNTIQLRLITSTMIISFVIHDEWVLSINE